MPGAAVAGTGDIDLTISGTIRAGACVPALASGGVVDYGQIATAALSDTEYTSLGRKTIGLQISCPASAQWGLRALDQRPGTVTDPRSHRFGLGQSSGENIGYYGVNIGKVVVDGAAGINLVTRDKVRWDDRQFFYNDAALINSFAVSGSSVPLPSTNSVAELSVDTYINPTSGLTVTNDVPLDGLVTLELMYY
nr:DUF1120 domain-containing protein [Stenotrophomonas maltophilia]